MATEDVRRAMAARTTDELRAICTEDAPDYSAEALALARAELVSRGEDVAALSPRVGEPRAVEPSTFHRAAKLYMAALITSLILSAAFGASSSPLATLLFSVTRVAVVVSFIGLAYERVRRRASPPPPRQPPKDA